MDAWKRLQSLKFVDHAINTENFNRRYMTWNHWKMKKTQK